MELGMKFVPVDPPRVFSVGQEGKAIQLKDCARLQMEPDEQVTFVTASGTEYDVVRKRWGYYALPSLDGRLSSFHLRPALVKSYNDRHFLLVVEDTHTAEFEAYLAEQGMRLVCWLDDRETLKSIDERNPEQNSR